MSIVASSISSSALSSSSLLSEERTGVDSLTLHHSPGGLATLVDLLVSGVVASTEGAGETEGGALAFLLGTLTGKGGAEGERLGSVAGGIFGTGGGSGEGALSLSSGSAFTSGSGLSEGEGDGMYG